MKPISGPIKTTGVFHHLLNQYPEVQLLIVNLAKKSETPTVIHAALLSALREKGVHNCDYPFTAIDQGRHALLRYLNQKRSQ